MRSSRQELQRPRSDRAVKRQFVDLGLRYPEPQPGTQPAVASPYMTSKEALVYLRLGSLSALYTHIRENGLPTCRCGGNLRFDRRELDAWMRGTTAIELARARRTSGKGIR